MCYTLDWRFNSLPSRPSFALISAPLVPRISIRAMIDEATQTLRVVPGLKLRLRLRLSLRLKLKLKLKLQLQLQQATTNQSKRVISFSEFGCWGKLLAASMPDRTQIQWPLSCRKQLFSKFCFRSPTNASKWFDVNERDGNSNENSGSRKESE